MRYPAVLFDMNGVIVDDEPLHLAAFQSVISNKGHSLTDQDYKKYFAGKTDEDGFRAYMHAAGLEYSFDSLMEEKAQQYLTMAQNTLRPYNGIIEFIKSLDKAGIHMGLVTSSLRIEADTVLRTFGIKDYFKATVTADDILNGKPNPEGYLKGAKALNFNPSECIVIEDAPSGVKAAKAAGMRCIAVLNTHFASELEEADELVEQLDGDSLDLLK